MNTLFQLVYLDELDALNATLERASWVRTQIAFEAELQAQIDCAAALDAAYELVDATLTEQV